MEQAVYTVDNIRSLERFSIESLHIPGDELMRRAGQATWHVLQTRWPDAQSITVLCGGGNNGGDGYVLARLAHESGKTVKVQTLVPVDQLTGEAQRAATAAKKAGVSMAMWEDTLEKADVIVDALLGIGIKGELREDVLSVIDTVNDAKLPVFSLDTPSGVNADTGDVHTTAVRAEATITFIGLKRGLLTGAAMDYVGELSCDNLSLPSEVFDTVSSNIKQVAEKPCLKPRHKNAHKGDFGHVLVIAGNRGFSGAARMAAEAALCTGAGLVSVATHKSHAAFLNIGRPELMVHAVESADDVKDLLEKATVLIVGPGLCRDAWAKALWKAALSVDKPTVLDADGLNILAESPMKKTYWILTPHPGEAGRLLQSDTKTIAQNRFDAAHQIQQRYGGVCILKGAGTLIDDGSTQSICTRGNPGMATAGMGDVLSGILGGLLAQGFSLSEAAVGGVCWHAEAGDRARQAGKRVVLATDLFGYLKMASQV